MLYQVKRAVISPFSQAVLVDAGEVLTAEALLLLNDELGIDEVICTVWMTWDADVYPTQIRHLPIVNSESMRFAIACDTAGLE